MNRYNIFLISFFVLSIFACDNKTSFSYPYPTEAKNIATFPKSLQGVYLNPKSKSIIRIRDKTIIINFNFDMKAPFDQHAFSSFHSQDESYIKREGDSLIIRKIMLSDTLFYLNRETILKITNGVYYVNKLTKDSSWDVYKMEFQHNNLLVSKIIPEHPADRFIKLAKTKKDTALLFENSSENRLNNADAKPDIIQAEVFNKIQ